MAFHTAKTFLWFRALGSIRALARLCSGKLSSTIKNKFRNMKMAEKSPSYASIQVIDRATNLLDAIARYGTASLKVLAAETGLHTSTAFRILASLDCHGFVARDEGGRYRLGARFLRLGARVRERLDVRQEARPVLEWLRTQLHETVNLTVRQGDEVVYVERAVGPKMMRVEHVIGSHAPLHVTAVGKLFLGEAGPEECVRYAKRTRLKPLTPNTITNVAKLQQQAVFAQREGYALDDQEAEVGVGCIGVPVRDSTGKMVAALSVSAPIERRRDAWITLLKQGAERLSARLGYTPETGGRVG